MPPTAGTGIENQGQLQTVIVTGYIVPRAGEGTQPVATIDQTFIAEPGRPDGFGGDPKATPKHRGVYPPR